MNDKNHAAAFISALTGNPNTVCDFRAIHETDRSVPAIPRRGSIDEHWSELCDWNERGYGIYIAINETDGHGRDNTNVTRFRAHMVDLDGPDAQQQFGRARTWEHPPAFGVNTSPRKFHLYWPLDGASQAGQWETVQRKLVTRWGGDPTIIDPARIMRLPGTTHRKGEPYPVVMWQLEGVGSTYNTEILDVALWQVTPSSIGGHGGDHIAIGSGERAPDTATAIATLHNIDVTQITDRNQWVAIGGAFIQSIDPADGQRGYEAFQEWNAPYPGNDPEANRKLWNDTLERGTVVKGWGRLHKEAYGLSPQQERLLGEKRDQRIQDDKIIGDDLGFEVTPEILTLDQMLQHFVFVSNGSQVVNRRTKTVRTISDAMNEYSASTYNYDTGKLDKDGNPVIKTVPAIKQWLIDDFRKTVDAITWIPGEGEFCRSPERNQGGDRAHNLWSGFRLQQPPENWQEWMQPFLDHVGYLVPDPVERSQFLKWCAHIFQQPGSLPHTCYLFVTKTTGTGRGTLGSMLTRALRGYVAANMNVDALFGGFNGRISQKLLATVDEIREGNSANRYEKQEAFKSKITEETRAINPKYGLQSVEKNCCRWLMFSNHHDALPFDNSDRRVIVIENPTFRQPQEYYTWLNGLLSNPHFIASIQEYLTTLDLTGFNPNEPAPMNAAKAKSLKSLETQFDKDAQQFAAQWPGRFATVSDLRDFMADDVPGPRAMSHIIERAGMKSAHKQKIGGKVETVLIVHGDLTPEDIINTDRSNISNEIMNYRSKLQI